MNALFQNALKRIPQKTPPIWFMRQAGRYHSHYQALRSKHTFDQLCKIPDLASEVALGPIMDFDFDVSILFSDILYPLEAIGMGLEYTDQGPRLGFQLNSQTFSDLNFGESSYQFMNFQKQAMILTREKLPKNKSLIGFVGGLWTLFVYAAEGGHAGSLIKSKTQLSLYKKFSDQLLPFILNNIKLQIEGGAEVVMIFDTAAGEVSPSFFQNHIQPYIEKIALTFPNKIGYYSKGTQNAFFNPSFNSLPLAGQGFDHRNIITDCFSLSSRGFVQGNFDQALLHMETDDLKRELHNYIDNIKKTSNENLAGWVCGLGHGILPKTPEKNVRLFIDTIRKEFS